MIFDTHVHSSFSSDSRSRMELMVDAALRAGLAGLAFTEHVEWYPGDEACGYLDPGAYFVRVQAMRDRYAGRITLLAGAELGSPHRFPKEAGELLAAWPWDFVIGSVHWVDGKAGWKPESFTEGLDAAYTRYFRELLLLAEEGEYDVLGHLDMVNRDAWDLYHELLPLENYAGEIRAVLRAAIERGKGLEINTSGWRKGLGQPCPPRLVLRWYRELGGEILTIGSDAHQPGHVGRDFDRARELALEAGFTRLARFAGRRAVDWIPL